MSEQDFDGSEEDLRYDPNQDPEEKRKIRERYRAQLRNLEDKAKDFKSLGINDLLAGVQRADESFNTVKAPQEAVLDSRLLSTVSSLSAAKARDLKHDGAAFETDDFIQRLVVFLGKGKADLESVDDGDVENDNILDWEKLGRLALRRTRRAPGLDFMLGPLNIEQKKKKVGKRAKLDKETGPAVRPDEVTEADIDKTKEAGAVSDIELTARLGQFISDLEEPVNVFKLLVNPHSFAQTVENFFFLAFLIKDGMVSLLSIDGEPYVEACEPMNAEDAEQGMAKQQGVWQIDMEMWEDAIQAYDITDPLFPHRPVPPEHTYAFYNPTQ
ncbi:nuclear protein [Tulasnella sp. 417]|nr:nuclear protein [Tulasnella sp. 417]